MVLHDEEPEIFPLTPAFPPSNRELVLCNICKILERRRADAAEQKRKQKLKESAYKQVESGMTSRQKEKVVRHLRK